MGTCSWKYGSWDGLVYSGPKPDNFLREYADHFRTVEIDQWFWSLFGADRVSLPDPRVVNEYASSVPEDFRFTVKVPNSITLTHFYKKHKSDPLVPNPHFLCRELFLSFLDRLKPIHNKIGSLMFQFEYLNKQKMSGLQNFLDTFGSFTAKCPEGFPYGVEIRNPNYLKAAYFDFLNTHRLHHVFLQGSYMPPITEVYYAHEASIRKLAVIRLHGPERKGIEARTGGKWNRRLEPRDSELDSVVDLIGRMVNGHIDIYLNVNNHYEGSAPLTIRKIEALLKSNTQ